MASGLGAPLPSSTERHNECKQMVHLAALLLLKMMVVKNQTVPGIAMKASARSDIFACAHAQHQLRCRQQAERFSWQQSCQWTQILAFMHQHEAEFHQISSSKMMLHGAIHRPVIPILASTRKGHGSCLEKVKSHKQHLPCVYACQAL